MCNTGDGFKLNIFLIIIQDVVYNIVYPPAFFVGWRMRAGNVGEIFIIIGIGQFIEYFQDMYEPAKAFFVEQVMHFGTNILGHLLRKLQAVVGPFKKVPDFRHFRNFEKIFTQ